MSKINIDEKQPGQELEATEFNQVVKAVNEVDVDANRVSHILFDEDFIEDGVADAGGYTVPVIKLKPGRVGQNETRESILEKVGVIPPMNLPPVYFTGVLGTGTEEDPYVVPGGGGPSKTLEEQLRELPGYLPGSDRVLFGGIDFRWDDLPNPATEKLATPIITFGAVGDRSIVVNWSAVPNATSSYLEYDVNVGFTNPITAYGGSLFTATVTGLSPLTTYYFRVKSTGSGYLPSDYATAVKATVSDGYFPIGGSSITVDDGHLEGADMNTIVAEADWCKFVTNKTIVQGQAGVLKFIPENYGVVQLSTNPVGVENKGDGQFGIDVNPDGLKIAAWSKTQGESAGSVSPVSTSVGVCTIELTTTGGSGGIGEILFKYDDVQWFKFNRTPGPFTIKGSISKVGVKLKSIIHKGFS